MERDNHFGMGGFGFQGVCYVLCADLIDWIMNACYGCINIYYKVADKGIDIYHKVVDSRKEVFAQQSRANEKDGLEKIPEIRAFEALAEIRGGLKGLI